MYGHPDAVSSGWPYIIISLLVLTFLNLCISVKASLINTKLGNLVNLGVLFMANNDARLILRKKLNGATT